MAGPAQALGEGQGGIRKGTGEVRRGAGVRPPRYEPALRVKRVRSSRDVWELTFAPDGRATFRYGEEVVGEPHIVWLRVGDHSILDAPEG